VDIVSSIRCWLNTALKPAGQSQPRRDGPSTRDWGTIIDTEECRFYFRFFGLFVRALPVEKWGGTTRSTVYHLQFRFGKKERELSFCWRPDLTHYYWIREKRLKNRTPEEIQKAHDDFLRSLHTGKTGGT
jgi:hypothetical protein